MKRTPHRSFGSRAASQSSPRFGLLSSLGGRSLSVVGLLLANQGVAWAQDDDVRACAGAYEQAQVMRNSGRLRESEEQLRVCVRDVCPDFVKIDCGQWLSDVRREMPSVILMVVDSSGAELSDVNVTIDGAGVSGTAGGTVIEVNPGPHAIVFERQGTSKTEHVNIRQGEKNRVVKVEFVSTVDSDGDGIIDTQDACPNQAGDLANRGCAPVVIEQPAEAQPLSGLQIGTIIAGGVGVAGFGTFAVAGLMSRSLSSDTIGKCDSEMRCPKGVDIDEAKKDEKRLNLIANIGLGVGAAGVVGAVVLFVLSGEPDASAQETGQISWQVAPTKGGAWLGVGSSF